MFPLQTLHYPYPLSTVFPSLPEVLNDRPSNGQPSNSPSKVNRDVESQDDILGTLQFVDYRYSRFALDPRTGLFCVIRSWSFTVQLCKATDLLRRYWRDPSWTGISSVQDGLPEAMRLQRLLLFDKNEINIQEKSVFSLLVEEVRSFSPLLRVACE